MLVGHKNERMRASFRAIMVQISGIYPTKELCPMLLHGIDSNILKNSKSRVNNIEEIGRLVSTVGHRQLFSNTKQIAALAQNLDERKGGVREATLETLAALWRSMNAAGGGQRVH